MKMVTFESLTKFQKVLGNASFFLFLAVEFAKNVDLSERNEFSLCSPPVLRANVIIVHWIVNSIVESEN